MRVAAAIALAPLAAQAINLVQSNDDGWAELNIRTFYDALTAAGFESFISAPADNESGTGSRDAKPAPRTDPCEFDSCPANSPATGRNASMPRFNYVNSYPVTSIKYGIDELAPSFYGGAPDFAVAGPNVGSNLGFVTRFSGTVGAATYAAGTAGIPAIAFSGSTGDQIGWQTTPVPVYSTVYADLATKVTQAVVEQGAPYLPKGVYLNVNFGDAGDGTSCEKADDFKFVLTRVHHAVPWTDDDVEQCGETRLPAEGDVIGADGCWVSISVGDASSKGDAGVEEQRVVRDRLEGLPLSCFDS